MMDESSHSSPSRGTPSMKLKSDDVLLGRGAALAQFEGNLRFRDLVHERQDEYKQTSMRKEKKRIAKQIYDLVTSRGGRFLKQDGSEATVDTAIEKCKQALRENRLPTVGKKRDQTDITNTNQSPTPSSTTGSGDNDVLSSELGSTPDVFSSPIASPIALPNAVPDVALNETLRRSEIGRETTASSAALPSGFASIPPSSQTSVPSVLSMVDPRLLLFRGSLMQPVLQQQVWIPQSAETTNPVLYSDISSANTLPPEVQSQVESLMSINIAAAVAHQRYLAEQAMYSMLRDFARLQTCNGHIGRQTLDEMLSESLMVSQDDSNGMAMIKLEKTSHPQAKVAPAAKDEAQTNDAYEEEIAAFLLSSLSVMDRPVITEEQEAMEKAELTDQEKTNILADAFGDVCNVNPCHPHQSKKAKTDLDEESIAFLVRQMVFEIEKIPLDKRVSLMEALSKGRPEEFSDKRLEMFLRCEGMNTKLAAERFINYWEGRRQVFGAEKYLMRMTLSEALKEDLVALDTCVFTLLPHQDLSGRQIMYMEPHRHSRKGYTSESMLRAIWYVSEIAAQENTNVCNGIVQVCWFENSSLFDYDLKVFDRWAYFLSSCWPLKLISNHLCCPTTIVNRIVKPIIHTFVSRDFRNRTLTHNVPAEDIITVLSKYGISQDMLPSEMGGNLRCHQSEWLANRRASEMEEI